MSEYSVITDGLKFPEGPIAMPDGSVIVVEIAAGRLTRVLPDGAKEIIAEPGGGPNGAAIGPDGACYVCNNGGMQFHEKDGLLLPGDMPEDYSGGRIERIDLNTGKVEVLYTEVNGEPLKGPNDIVFDKNGGFWFTDLGKGRGRSQDRGGLYYAKIDGSLIREAVFPIPTANGVGLSPDEKTVYVADTLPGRLWAMDIVGEGEVARPPGPRMPGRLVGQPTEFSYFDSLAVDADGNICVATIYHSGITIFSPDGSSIRHVPTDDLVTTNICFGGKDLRTAYITLSSAGKLVSMPWERPGLALNFLNK
ncbi:SMP-30/gluconolactonase/LRE family protein [Alloalcanivorax mobilis]|uniref:SMP-30/gluconolactonase/LRE family protein n=1 Tax=Alloalcanivorax mobilis TaxID=2019569 RepID=UPI000B5B39E4|nr:SMP-30/gluconolactonase/LRE family protein [Alloalcanivorax mobilis]ASK33576.1 gluconolaconase [Alcanivorax sp. N3-2A]|tara:strand:+ start:21989 stop:22909 length:921 start_codon:yes stop_codon:yes gene_type:complete